MTLQVLCIGYGEMGHAMEYLLADHCDFHVWTRRPVEGHDPVVLETAVAAADIVLYCIPVTPLEDVAARVYPHLREHSLSLSVAKGLDEKGRPAFGALQAVYADARDFGVLYGPMISEEIINGRPSYAQLATSRGTVPAQPCELFDGTGLVVAPIDDINGISWASVLKNVYAILFGAADELGLGDNLRGALCVACLDEMESLVLQAGGKTSSVRGLAGLGDLVATATSEDSHHHAIGRRLARGDTGDIRGEGVHTLSMLERHSLLDVSDTPLLRLVRDLLTDAGDVEERLCRQVEIITKSRLVR